MKQSMRAMVAAAVAVVASMPVTAHAAPNQACAGHGGVRAATVRPGAGVIEVIVYCNDGPSEGPFVYEIR
jgi:hypothetical protein